MAIPLLHVGLSFSQGKAMESGASALVNVYSQILQFSYFLTAYADSSIVFLLLHNGDST